MRKILFLLTNAKVGGAEKITIELANQLTYSGYEVDLFLFFKYGGLINRIDKKINVYYAYEMQYISMLKSFCSILRKLLKLKNDYDVVFAPTEIWPTFIGAIYSYRKNIKLICWVHSALSLTIKKYGFLKRNLFDVLSCVSYKYSYKTILVSSNIRKFFKYKSDTVVVFNGCDILDIIRKSQFNIEDVKLNKDIITILSVCRLEKEKNVKLLLKAIEILVKENFNIRLLVVGDGSERNNLEEYVEKKNLKEVIHFLGKKDNPYPYFRLSDIYVSSSLYEGFGLSVVEAMALGNAVVTTDGENSASTLIENNISGIVVKNNDLADLCYGLRKLLSDEKFRKNIANGATEKSKLYDKKIFMKNIIKILDKV